MPDPVEEPEVEEDEEEAEPDSLEEAETEVAPGEEVESSWEELLQKRAAAGEEDDEESLFDLSPEERVESLSIRATPPQPDEFVCANCRLVKKKSQLADRRRRLCLDCV